MSEIGTDQTYVHHILSEINGEHELSKHNGLEPLKLVFMRKREREREGVVHNVLKLLLRIFELKIKFAFYDLPCSFPIKRIFRRLRFIYLFISFSLLKLLFLSTYHFLSHTTCIRSFVRFLGLSFLMRTNARIPNFATVN